MTQTPLALFVYGSLLDPAHRADVLGRPVSGVVATLPGFERGRSRHWFVRPRPGASTAGLALEALGPDDLAVLDRYEEVPTLYTRQQVDVVMADGAARRCWIYLPAGWVDEDA